MDTTLAMKVTAIVARDSGATNVVLETPLKTLGLDSLEFMQLIITLREEAGEISDEQVARVETVEDLVRAIEGKL